MLDNWHINGYYSAIWQIGGHVVMIVRTRSFELNDGCYRNLSELAGAMGISVSQIYRVREGKRRINQKFIVGAKKPSLTTGWRSCSILSRTATRAEWRKGRRWRC